MKMIFRNWLFAIAALITAYAYGDPCYTGIWDITTGYRHDSFEWSIAGANGFPGTLAEIDWKNIHSAQVGTKWLLAGIDSIYTRFDGYWAQVVQPDITYKAFRSDGRKKVKEVFCRGSREKGGFFCDNGGHIFEAKWGIGAHLCSCPKRPKRYDIAALVGYSCRNMRLRSVDPKLVFDDTSPFKKVSKCIRCLCYRYKPCKSGGWAGLDGFFRIGRCLNLFVAYEWHFAAFRASGSWRWREPSRKVRRGERQEEFKLRWKECSTAWGNIATTTLTYHACDNWYFGVFAMGEYWRSRKGEYCPTVLKDTVSEFREAKVRLPTKTATLNPITWLTYYVGVDMQCRF
ncbi:MAG: hypothetical protein WB791_10695 [Waddliaceae bacterium]